MHTAFSRIISRSFSMDRARTRIATLGLHLEPPMAQSALTLSMERTMATNSGSKRPRADENGGDTGVYILGVARTPLGAFQGGLSSLSATDLGAVAIRAALERAGVSPDAVQHVYMGNVCSANLGQAPARQAALKAGLPIAADCTTVNKVCSSGMKAIAMAAQDILLGHAEIAVAGGMESMSNVPYYSPSTRAGARLGNVTLVDGVVHDGLWDPYDDVHMGECAELCADEHGFSRADQDAHAVESSARAKRAAAAGVCDWEIVPVEVRGRKGAVTVVRQDEAPSKMDEAKLRQLRPSFRPGGNGTVTAGNASPLTDGAAAVVLASATAVKRLGLRPLAQLLATADAAQAPKQFTTAPSKALPIALSRAGLEPTNVDAWEINEAFSVVELANRKILGLDAAKVNILGGAVAMGHPIGCSGARIVVTLINALRTTGGKVGAAGICNGGGGASACVIRRLTDDVEA